MVVEINILLKDNMVGLAKDVDGLPPPNNHPLLVEETVVELAQGAALVIQHLGSVFSGRRLVQ